MKLMMDFFELATIDLRVDLCGGNAGMSQHFLDDTKIGAAREQVCGKRMAQLMRMHCC